VRAARLQDEIAAAHGRLAALGNHSKLWLSARVRETAEAALAKLFSGGG